MWITLRGCNGQFFSMLANIFAFVGGKNNGILPSQFVRAKEPDYYIYTEHVSRNCSRELAQLNTANKEVAGYATPDNKPRCIVFLLDLYMSKLPKYAFDKDVFFSSKGARITSS